MAPPEGRRSRVSNCLHPWRDPFRWGLVVSTVERIRSMKRGNAWRRAEALAQRPAPKHQEETYRADKGRSPRDHDRTHDRPGISFADLALNR
jgi:hypothetical protein